jgi:hypothetical protein
MPANDLEFRYGVNAPTLQIEGLTLADASSDGASAAIQHAMSRHETPSC